MARQRSTWKNDRQAASSRTADIYTMNQEHPQPSPVDYENGDPDSWAETPTKNGNVNKTYDGDSEARNEIGLGEFAPDTWDHKGTGPWGDSSGKYDNQKPINASTRKAAAAERVAASLLRTANKDLVEQQALDLMGMPDKILVATLKRLDQVSPDALTKEAKLRRSYACVKLSASILPAKEAFESETAWQNSVQKMATTFMTVDDPTLKSLIRQAAEANKHLAADEEEEDDASETASAAPTSSSHEEEDDASETASAAPAAPTAGDDDSMGDDHGSRVEVQSQGTPPVAGGNIDMVEEEDGDVGCMSTDDAAMLDSMTQEGPAMPAAPAPLTDLFGGAPAAPEAMPGLASNQLDISFDDDDVEGSHTASGLPDGSDLANVFGDNEEVQAQREIVAAEQEQRAREFGYSQNIHTASEGAKKLGQVSRKQGKQGDDLAGLWS